MTFTWGVTWLFYFHLLLLITRTFLLLHKVQHQKLQHRICNVLLLNSTQILANQLSSLESLNPDVPLLLWIVHCFRCMRWILAYHLCRFSSQELHQVLLLMHILGTWKQGPYGLQKHDDWKKKNILSMKGIMNAVVADEIYCTHKDRNHKTLH